MGEREQAGLERFFALAAEVGVVAGVAAAAVVHGASLELSRVTR